MLFRSLPKEIPAVEGQPAGGKMIQVSPGSIIDREKEAARSPITSPLIRERKEVWNVTMPSGEFRQLPKTSNPYYDRGNIQQEYIKTELEANERVKAGGTRDDFPVEEVIGAFRRTYPGIPRLTANLEQA